jgi:hypothetical protein
MNAAAGARHSDTPPDGVELARRLAEERAKLIAQANSTADACDKARKNGRRLPTGKHRLPKGEKSG